MIEFCVGEPVPARDLLFRDAFIERVWAEVACRHTAMVGARRTGKTSVMHHMRDKPANGWDVLYLNVQDLKHPSELLESLIDEFRRQHPESSSTYQAIMDWVGKRVGWLLGRIDSIEGAKLLKIELRKDAAWRREWKRHGQEIFGLIRKQGRNVLVIIDEFPDFLLNVCRSDNLLAADLLSWFRCQRLNPSPDCDCIRWLLGGSINLVSTIDRMGCSGLMNDCRFLDLPVLGADEVAQFFTRMLGDRSVPFHAGVPERFAERLGRPIPFFMQAVTQSLCRNFERNRHVVTAEVVDRAFDDLANDPAIKDKLRHFCSRLDKYYHGIQLKAAKSLLKELSRSGPDGLCKLALLELVGDILRSQNCIDQELSSSEVLGDILRDLENEFYIVECQSGYYDFAYGVLKQWWRKYYG